MEVSVIIPTYNEENHIAGCLESLVNQTKPPREIIVVDNNCTDQSIKIAEKFHAQIVHESQQGITPARNRGFNQAQSEIIARCDADTQVTSEWIEKILDDFRSQSIDALSGPVIFKDLISDSPVYTKTFFKSMRLLQKGKDTLLGSNMAISQEMWRKVRFLPWPEDKDVHEDIYLAIKINQLGGCIYFDKSLIAYSSSRRIKKKPFSFFAEYPLRLVKTLKYMQDHNL